MSKLSGPTKVLPEGYLGSITICQFCCQWSPFGIKLCNTEFYLKMWVGSQMPRQWSFKWSTTSVQRIVIFHANRNRNRFAELNSVRIGLRIICEFQNLQIGIGIIFVRWEVFANNSQIPDIYFFSTKFLIIFFYLEKLTWQTKL